MWIVFLNLVFVLRVSSDSQGEGSQIDIENPIQNITRVLICLNQDSLYQLWPYIGNIKRKRHFPTLSIEYHNVENCVLQIENNKTNLLAVLSPKTLSLKLSESDILIYFYDSAQFGEYDDIFPNSVTPINDWRPLEHAFTHFFEKQNWSRIAILSDNTPFSAAFEEELVRYFSKKQLVYDVQRCQEVSTTSKCNFWRALRYIKENQAVIVVLNVEACNAAALVEAARAQGLWRQFVMLARDWPFESYEAGAQVFGETFSLTLTPMRSEVHSRLRVSDNDGPHLVSILHGLALIRHAVKVVPKERIDYFYRDIATFMNTYTLFDTYESQAFIRKITPNSSSVVTIITANSHQVISFTEVASAGLSNYDVDCVIMRSNIFRKPCNDLWIILSVVMAVVFVLGMILIMNFYG